MKTKKKCAICANRFEPTRLDAKYYSNACKQKAYTQREKAELQPKETETVFYMDEYEYLKEFYGCDYEVFDLIFFCFLRRNYSGSGKENRENLINYFNSIWTGNNYEELKGRKAYRSFREKFLEGNFKIF